MLTVKIVLIPLDVDRKTHKHHQFIQPRDPRRQPSTCKQTAEQRDARSHTTARSESEQHSDQRVACSFIHNLPDDDDLMK